MMAILLLAAAGFAVASNQSGLVFEIEQSRETFIDLQNHIAAAATVATGGAAKGSKLFTQEGDRAVSALPGMDVDSGFVDKPHSAVDYSRSSSHQWVNCGVN